MVTTIQTANHKGFTRTLTALIFLCLCLGAASIRAQQPPVTTQVEITKRTGGNQPAGAATDLSNVAIWLDPLDRAAENTSAPNGGHVPLMVQRNKTFEPHVLVVQTGTAVQFPNKDPFLHNVFSLFNGKRFDLGFYEAGSSKSVHFDRAGVSFLFCSIHEEMTAVVVSVNTPYYALSDRSGRVTIPNVPDGRYQMHVWYERSLPENLKNLDRTVQVSNSNRSLDRIRVLENPDFTLAHKNKYGQNYVPPSSLGYTP
jgi:plastocyanin